MIETSAAARLEEKRFVFHPDSLKKMKILRGVFENLQGNYPYLCGLGFFGSRTKGIETEDSDYDVCIFYDSSKMVNGKDATMEWMRIVGQLEYESDLILDDKIYSPKGGLRIDICQKQTEADLEAFIFLADKAMQRFGDDWDLILDELFVTQVQELYARFFLAVGDEIYENRGYVLNKLWAEPAGEIYLQLLLKLLAWFERFSKDKSVILSRISSFPQTIEEAKKYFCVYEKNAIQQ